MRRDVTQFRRKLPKFRKYLLSTSSGQKPQSAMSDITQPQSWYLRRWSTPNSISQNSLTPDLKIVPWNISSHCTWTCSNILRKSCAACVCLVKPTCLCRVSFFRRTIWAIIMCYSAFAAKGVTHRVKAIRSKGLSHQARTTSGSDELPSSGVEAI